MGSQIIAKKKQTALLVKVLSWISVAIVVGLISYEILNTGASSIIKLIVISGVVLFELAGIIFATICSKWAVRINRNPTIAYIVGFGLNFFGLLIYRLYFKPREEKKDWFYATISFLLSLFFFVPLFNIAFCIGAVTTAILSIKQTTRFPKQYGGRGYAIAGLILGLGGIVLTIIGLIIYLMSDRICLSSICSAVYNNSTLFK